MMKRVQSDNVLVKLSENDGSSGRVVERNATAPPSNLTKKPLRSALKYQPRIPLSLQSVFLESQRHGEATFPPPSKIAFFSRKWSSTNEEQVERNIRELQFGLDQVRIVSPMRKRTNFNHEEIEEFNENAAMCLNDDRWKARSLTESKAPLRPSKSCIHIDQKCSLLGDSVTITSQLKGDRWTETSEIVMSLPPLRRSKSFNHNCEQKDEDESTSIVQRDSDDICRWKDSHIKSLAPPKPPRRHSEK